MKLSDPPHVNIELLAPEQRKALVESLRYEIAEHAGDINTEMFTPSDLWFMLALIVAYWKVQGGSTVPEYLISSKLLANVEYQIARLHASPKEYNLDKLFRACKKDKP